MLESKNANAYYYKIITSKINLKNFLADHFLCKIGGPVYRIGVGGGAASSVQVKISNELKSDWGFPFYEYNFIIPVRKIGID